MSLARRRLAFWAITLALPLIGLELASFALARLRPDLFDDREAVLAQITLADFSRALPTMSDTLGWDNPASAQDCASAIAPAKRSSRPMTPTASGCMVRARRATQSC